MQGITPHRILRHTNTIGEQGRVAEVILAAIDSEWASGVGEPLRIGVGPRRQPVRKLAEDPGLRCGMAVLAELVVQTSDHLARDDSVAGEVPRFLSYYTVIAKFMLMLSTRDT